MKAEHKEILKKLEQYLSKDGAESLRFTQALFNLGVYEQVVSNERCYLEDNHNQSDEETLRKIDKNIWQ